METLELQKDMKEESDEEDDDDEESGRLRFKTERKEGTIIRLSDVTRERRNIPETLGNFWFWPVGNFFFFWGLFPQSSFRLQIFPDLTMIDCW